MKSNKKSSMFAPLGHTTSHGARRLNPASAARLLIGINAHVTTGDKIGEGLLAYGIAALAWGAEPQEVVVLILESKTDATDQLDVQAFCDAVATLPNIRVVKNVDNKHDHFAHALIIEGSDAAAEAAAQVLIRSAVNRVQAGEHKGAPFDLALEANAMIAKGKFKVLTQVLMSGGLVRYVTAFAEQGASTIS